MLAKANAEVSRPPEGGAHRQAESMLSASFTNTVDAIRATSAVSSARASLQLQPLEAVESLADSGDRKDKKKERERESPVPVRKAPRAAQSVHLSF